MQFITVLPVHNFYNVHTQTNYQIRHIIMMCNKLIIVDIKLYNKYYIKYTMIILIEVYLFYGHIFLYVWHLCGRHFEMCVTNHYYIMEHMLYYFNF